VKDIMGFVKESREVHLIIFIITFGLLVIPDSVFVFISGIAIGNGWKITLSVFCFASFVLILYDLITGKWKKKPISEYARELRNKFNSEDMRLNLQKVEGWLKENSIEAYGGQKKLTKEKQDVSFDSVDKSRRNISHFYHDVRKMVQNRELSKHEVKFIVSSSQVEFLLEKIEPLEEQIRLNYDRTTFRFFRKLY
jgi:hypothetical protein